MTARVQRRRREAGSAIIEFALSAVFLLVLLIGIIDVGRALYAYDWLSHSARAATRWSMVRGFTCTELPVGCPAYKADITAYVKNTNGNGLDTTGIDTSQLTVTPGCYVTGQATSSDPPCTQGTWVGVSLAYNFHFLSPFLPLPPWTMHSNSRRIVQQ